MSCNVTSEWIPVMLRLMAVKRMDNVAIIVKDLKAAIAFFTELGLKLEGEATVEGKWVDDCIGVDGARSRIAMMRMPDGHGAVELSQFERPTSIDAGLGKSPVNTLGMHRIMFAVDDLDEVLTRLRKHGAKVVREVVQYEDIYRLCYIRGPEGIFIGLAQALK